MSQPDQEGPIKPGQPQPTPAFATPAQPLQYVMPEYRGRPGLITAIAVISIVVASLSILYSLMTVLQGGMYYMMSVVSTTVSASTARPGAPPRVTYQATASAGAASATPAAGMNARQREATIRAMTQLQPLLPTRKRHLDAILAASGRSMGTDDVTDAGRMPELNSSETPPDYFVTSAGRLELFNDRAVFYPSNGSPAVRVSAPPEPAPGGPPAAATDGAASPDEPAADGASPDAAPATSPSSTGPALALTPAEVQSVVQQAQSSAANRLNPAQVKALQNLVTAPGQQLVMPGAAQASVLSAYVAPAGQVSIQFSNGGSVTLGPQGNVVSLLAAPVMPSFSFNPFSLALMIVTAVVSLGLAIFLLVCGILMLRQSPRARRLHLVYAFLKIPLAVVAGLASAWVLHDLMASVAGAGVPAATGPALFTGAIPAVLGCAYPVALLIALNLRQVRDYYAVGQGGPPGAPAA